jgi:hypothetical protein
MELKLDTRTLQNEKERRNEMKEVLFYCDIFHGEMKRHTVYFPTREGEEVKMQVTHV